MNNMNDVMLKVKKAGSWLSFTTYDRQHGRSMRFLTLAESAMEALDANEYAQFLDADCGNFVRLSRVEDKLRIVFTWLSSCNDDISGYRQYAEIPYSALAACYAENSTQKFLCHAEISVSPRIDASRACRNIRRAIAEKHSRRAFIRAMRDNFQWRDEETIVLYDDWGNDFFFYASSGLHGGLIRHEYGGKITYAVHT